MSQPLPHSFISYEEAFRILAGVNDHCHRTAYSAEPPRHGHGHLVAYESRELI